MNLERKKQMSGKKITIFVIGFVIICAILIYLSISIFYKNNPHQPNQKSLGLITEITHK